MAVHTLHIDRAKLQAVGVNGARKLVTRVIRRTFNRSQILCPVDMGYLRAGATMNVAARAAVVRGKVEYPAKYAMAVHEGRRALTIRAKGNGRLRFVVDGRVVYARSVHQPARRGRPFLRTALFEVATQSGFMVHP